MLNSRCLLAKNEVTLKYFRKLITFTIIFNKKNIKLGISNMGLWIYFNSLIGSMFNIPKLSETSLFTVLQP